MSLLVGYLCPETGRDGAADEQVEIFLRRVQTAVVAQVLALAATVVVQPAHIAVGEPGRVDAQMAQCHQQSGLATGGIDVGDVHQLVGVLHQQPVVSIREPLRLAVEPYGGIAVAECRDGIRAAADNQQHVELLLATLGKQAAHQLKTVDVALRLLSYNQESMALVGVARLVDLIERLRQSLLVGIVALLGKDRVRGCRAAHVHLISASNLHLADTFPPVGIQVFGLDVGAPAAQVKSAHTIKEADTRHLSQLFGTGLTAFHLGLVGARREHLLHTVVLSQLLDSHAELVLTIATRPHVKVDRREESSTFAHAVVLHMPVGMLVVGAIEVSRRCALLAAQAKRLLAVNHCIIHYREQVADDVESVASGVVDSFQQFTCFHNPFYF